MKYRWQIFWVSYHCSFLQYRIVKNTTIPQELTANSGIMFYSLEFYLTHKFPKKINMYRPIFSDYCAGMAYWGKIWQIAIFLFLKAYDDRGSANEAMVQFRQNKDSRILIPLLLLEKQLPPSYWYIKISPVLNIDCYALR